MASCYRFDRFLAGYLECALWLTYDEEGAPVPSASFPPVTALALKEDAYSWFVRNVELLDGVEPDGRTGKWELAGHDFWLTRNGHGCGFWDGDWGPTEKAGTPADWFPKTAADMLTIASKEAGNLDTYIGDDGEVYASGLR